MDFVMPLLSGIISTFSENPLAQTLGFGAMFVGLFAFFTDDDNKTIKVFIAANIVWVLHFFFMENHAALGACVIGLSRLILSLRFKKNVKVLVGVVIVSIAFGYMSFDGKIISILPLIGTVIGTYGFFFLERLQLRLLLLGLSSLWFTYHVFTGSMGGVVNEIIVSIAICVSIYKFYFGEEKKQYLRERIRNVLRKRPPRPDFERFMYLRDKDRFK